MFPASRIDRLPAIPLIANDPYFSYWMPADTLTGATVSHWAGAPKPIKGHLTVDGKRFTFLGHDSQRTMNTQTLIVTPTQTRSQMEADGVRCEICFWSPALPDDPDILSLPVTFVDIIVSSADGAPHIVKPEFDASSALTFDGIVKPELYHLAYEDAPLNMAVIGQKNQRILSPCGDHVTIDWGYLYMASSEKIVSSTDGLSLNCEPFTVENESRRITLMLAYDDIASINYFGTCCKAWGLRHGETIPEVLKMMHSRRDELLERCRKLDDTVLNEAYRIGGEDYASIAAAAWRHTFAAHKLIATPKGEMAFLSKENDSNGCIGTVDVSYPSVPLFLKYCPELVNAMCRPILEFASMPVWKYDFAPHDVGRYPWATGQNYAYRPRPEQGHSIPPLYALSAAADVYLDREQMPVEESGNMLIMLEAAITFGADVSLIKKYMPLLEKWVQYLNAYGEDPGEQLCTDDFAGHLAHNINLSAKAIVGIACYARILNRMGSTAESARWNARAKEMAESWLVRAKGKNGTALTFDGNGWSMKYNLVWDRVLGLGLLPDSFYEQELHSYLGKINEYGLPLDSRSDYTKSDWILWTSAMAPDQETFNALVAPVAHYLKATPSRVAFSDWFDTKSGMYMFFIARSVQGGLYMPFLNR